MLTCREVTDNASAMIDAELGLRKRIAVRLHLMMCKNCRRFVRQLRTLVGSLASRSEADSQSASEEFVDQTMKKLDRAQDLSQSLQGDFQC
jgi:anti-sigma factor ChrR (cupin superfamily)